MANHFKIPLWVWFSFITINLIPSLAQTENYIVHMDLSSMPKAFSSQHSWYLSSLASALDVTKSQHSLASKLLYSYTHVVNGFSASLTVSELEALKNYPGYVYSIKDSLVKPDTTRSPQFLGLTADSGAWSLSNYGDGIIIGVVDSGIWPESKSYSDNGISDVPTKWKGKCESGTQFNSSLCNKKLIGARCFNKGLVARLSNINISMNSVRDTDGHGTHTSSTAAGNFVEGASFFGYAPGVARGVAPKAHVAVYKALWDEGAVLSDVIAAIDQAIEDGVDVLSISLGLDGVPLYQDPIALATFAAVEKNIFVSASAGNEGPFEETLHNGIPWTLTVAAGTVDREFGAELKLGNGVSVMGSSLYVGDFSATQFPIVLMDTCLNLTELNKIGNKIVVCQDEDYSISDDFVNVGSAKVTAGVFIANITDIESFIQSSFPAVIMTPKVGEDIKDYIKSVKNSQASLEFKKTNVGIKSSPMVTSYSSRGPSPSCPFVLKPDIMAPGSLVLAAWPENVSVGRVNSRSLFSKFNLMSGTSMSCPHAAGVAALVKKAHPDWSPAAIRSAMMTTADSVDHTSGPIKDIGNDNKPATPLAMGAGQVNPNKAMDPGFIYDLNTADYVKFLCALNYTKMQIQTITKSSSIDCSKPSLDLNYPSFITFFNDKDSKSNSKFVREFHRTVTNVGEAVSTYIATVPAMKNLKVTVMPAKLEFKSKNQKLRYKLIIEGPRLSKDSITFGYLKWVEAGGKHVVKSPIVATSLNPETLSSSRN